MKRPKIVIIGGGFGGVETFRRLHRFIHKRRADVTLVDKNNYFLFTPMLHEVATGSISRTHLTQPLRQMIHCCQERFVRATVKKIDRTRRAVVTDNGELPYDYCVVAAGSRSYEFGVPGVSAHAYPLKTLQDCSRIRNRVVHCFEEAGKCSVKTRRCELLHFIIVGGGPTGVEMAGQLGQLIEREMRALYPQVNFRETMVTIVESGEKVLSRHSDYFGIHAMRKLKQLGVQTVTNTRVVKVEENRVMLKSGHHLSGCTVIWTSGVRSNADQIFRKDELDESMRVKVKEFLHMVDDKRVYAVGDCANIADPSLGFVPQTAQAATQAAITVAANLKRAVLGKPLKPYRYFSKGDLVPIGDWFAVAQLGPVRFKGRIAWWVRRTVFLATMYSWSDRLRIVLDWTLNIFTYRDTSEL